MCKLQLSCFLYPMSKKIRHSGVIDSIADGGVKVRILQASACAACKVAGHCSASEAKEKIVDVYCTDSSGYSEGQEVVVTASREVANYALALGFGIPFLLLFVTLVVALRMTGNEGVAALWALGALIPYYLLLWLLHKNISRHVAFSLEE